MATSRMRERQHPKQLPLGDRWHWTPPSSCGHLRVRRRAANKQGPQEPSQPPARLPPLTPRPATQTARCPGAARGVGTNNPNCRAKGGPASLRSPEQRGLPAQARESLEIHSTSPMPCLPRARAPPLTAPPELGTWASQPVSSASHTQVAQPAQTTPTAGRTGWAAHACVRLRATPLLLRNLKTFPGRRGLNQTFNQRHTFHRNHTSGAGPPRRSCLPGAGRRDTHHGKWGQPHHPQQPCSQYLPRGAKHSCPHRNVHTATSFIRVQTRTNLQ